MQHMRQTFNFLRKHPFRLLLLLIWCYFIYTIIMAGFEIDPFLTDYRYNDITERDYPTQAVIFLVGAMIAQAIIFTALNRLSDSTLKYFTMLIISMGYVGLSALMSMHAPPEVIQFTLWQLLFFVIISSFCLGNMLYWLYNRLF